MVLCWKQERGKLHQWPVLPFKSTSPCRKQLWRTVAVFLANVAETLAVGGDGMAVVLAHVAVLVSGVVIVTPALLVRPRIRPAPLHTPGTFMLQLATLTTRRLRHGLRAYGLGVFTANRGYSRMKIGVDLTRSSPNTVAAGESNTVKTVTPNGHNDIVMLQTKSGRQRGKHS